MPVVWRKEESNYSIVIWQSTESLDQLFHNASLNEIDTTRLNGFQSESRKREWLTVRNAIQEIHPSTEKASINYDLHGKPHLLPDKCISISHSKDLITVMTSPLPHIGIDIELIHPRINKLSKKFINDTEESYLDVTAKLENLHVIWGAKEVLFKIHSIGNIDFKKDLFIHPFIFSESGQVTASLRKKGFEKDFKVQYERTGKYMLAWGMED